MIRTQVYLTQEQARAIKLRAKREQRREAEVIRELLNKGLQAENLRSTGDALLELVELGKHLGVKGPKDWSTNHDDYFAKEV